MKLRNNFTCVLSKFGQNKRENYLLISLVSRLVTIWLHILIFSGLVRYDRTLTFLLEHLEHRAVNVSHLPPPQALHFSRSGESATRVTGDEAPGTMRRKERRGQARFPLPTFLCAQIFIETGTPGYEAGFAGIRVQVMVMISSCAI